MPGPSPVFPAQKKNFQFFEFTSPFEGIPFFLICRPFVYLGAGANPATSPIASTDPESFPEVSRCQFFAGEYVRMDSFLQSEGPFRSGLFHCRSSHGWISLWSVSVFCGFTGSSGHWRGKDSFRRALESPGSYFNGTTGWSGASRKRRLPSVSERTSAQEDGEELGLFVVGPAGEHARHGRAGHDRP